MLVRGRVADGGEVTRARLGSVDYMVLRRWASQQTVGGRCSSGGSIILLWKRRITVVSASSLSVLPSVPANDEGATLLGLARLEMTML